MPFCAVSHHFPWQLVSHSTARGRPSERKKESEASSSSSCVCQPTLFFPFPFRQAAKTITPLHAPVLFLPPSPFSPFHPSSLPKCPGGFFFPLLRRGLRFADEMRGSLCVLFKIETACRSVNIHFKVAPHVSPLFRKRPKSNYLFWSDKDLKVGSSKFGETLLLLLTLFFPAAGAFNSKRQEGGSSSLFARDYGVP